MPVQTVGALSPFPEPVLSPETTLNLKTHPNMHWSPAMNHCISGHWGKVAKISSQEGEEGCRGSCRNHRLQAKWLQSCPGMLAGKREFPQCSCGSMCSRGLSSALLRPGAPAHWDSPVILCGSRTRAQGNWPAVGARWAGRAGWSVTGRSAVPTLAEEAGGRQLWPPCRAGALGLSYTEVLSLAIPGLSEGGNGDDHHSPGLENITLHVIREGVGIWWAWWSCRCWAVPAFIQLFPATSLI